MKYAGIDRTKVAMNSHPNSDAVFLSVFTWTPFQLTDGCVVVRVTVRALAVLAEQAEDLDGLVVRPGRTSAGIASRTPRPRRAP